MEGMFDRATGCDRIGHAIKLWYRYPLGPWTLARYCCMHSNMECTADASKICVGCTRHESKGNVNIS
jgi:hypothetical protein